MVFLFIVAAAVTDASARDHAYKCVLNPIIIAYTQRSTMPRDDNMCVLLHQYTGEHVRAHTQSQRC